MKANWKAAILGFFFGILTNIYLDWPTLGFGFWIGLILFGIVIAFSYDRYKKMNADLSDDWHFHDNY